MLTREALFARLGVIRLIDPLTQRAYDEIEREIWEQDLDNSPHGQPWHTSFHASSSPGDDPTACGRKAVYGLMNLPEPTPTKRFLRAVAEAGMAIEDSVVSRWEKTGILLSNSANAEFQTGFADTDHWLTGNCDAVILPFRWRKPHVVEVKSKAQTKVEEMAAGQRKWDDKHRLQCMTYISFVREQQPFTRARVCKESWKIENEVGVCRTHGTRNCLVDVLLDPCESGSIYYVSRDDPSTTFEFYFDYDPEFMKWARKNLALWRDAFIAEELPDRPHHPDGKLVGWSEEPCKWCPLKKHVCKPDYQAKVESLPQSHALAYAKDLRQNYNYETTRQQVLDRWK